MGIQIEDEELRAYADKIGHKEYRRISMYECNLSKRIRNNNLRASRTHYENSSQKIDKIKEKYKNGVTKDILNEMFDS